MQTTLLAESVSEPTDPAGVQTLGDYQQCFGSKVLGRRGHVIPMATAYGHFVIRFH